MAAETLEHRMARHLFRPTNDKAVEQVEALLIAVQQLHELMLDSHGVAGVSNDAGDEVRLWSELIGDNGGLANWLDGFADARSVYNTLQVEAVR
jgi:hypothetical protein